MLGVGQLGKSYIICQRISGEETIFEVQCTAGTVILKLVLEDYGRM
jgi:hypothetical protein